MPLDNRLIEKPFHNWFYPLAFWSLSIGPAENSFTENYKK